MVFQVKIHESTCGGMRSDFQLVLFQSCGSGGPDEFILDADAIVFPPIVYATYYGNRGGEIPTFPISFYSNVVPLVSTNTFL